MVTVDHLHRHGFSVFPDLQFSLGSQSLVRLPFEYDFCLFFLISVAVHLVSFDGTKLSMIRVISVLNLVHPSCVVVAADVVARGLYFLFSGRLISFVAQ